MLPKKDKRLGFPASLLSSMTYVVDFVVRSVSIIYNTNGHYSWRCPSGKLTKLVARTVHGDQGWVRFPSRAPHLPGVVTYNAVLLPCLNAKIRMFVDVLCRMKSPFVSLLAYCIGAARIWSPLTIPATHPDEIISHT